MKYGSVHTPTASSHIIVAIIFGLILLGAPTGWADDVGISKARLIQQSEKSYVLEVDVTRALVWAIKAPIFPDRFQVSELAFINQAGWIVVQATASTAGEPLSAEDEILLPWMRNGAAITVQWQDGSLQQGLFLRSLEGIHVPMRLLMPTTQSLADVCRQHAAIGLKHLIFKWIHLLLVGALVCLQPSRRVFTALLVYAFGQAFSLVLADVGLPGFDLLLVDILGVILLFLLAHAAARQESMQPFFPLLFFFGLIHGLAYAQNLAALGVTLDYKLPALLMFNAAVDIGHFATAGLLLLVAKLLGKLPHWQKVVSTVIGALSVALLAVLFQANVLTGKTRVPAFGDSQLATQFRLPVSQKPQTGGQRPGGVRRLTNPVMSYLSVQPYEVRQEILVQARAAVRFLGIDDTGKASIPLPSLEPVKKGLLVVVQKANPVFIDGQPATPVLARADFVTLGPTGVMVRPEPEVESLDNGVVGLTLVYETPEMADEILIDWGLFSETVPKIEATITDPFGGATMILSAKENRWRWKSRLSGYRVPVLEKIAVEKHRLPIISLLLFALLGGTLIFSIFRKKLRVAKPVLMGMAALGFLLYPFVSFPVEIPWVAQWKPSAERTAIILEGLLTNVYRAFDVRDENRVYDRLAMSVAGDQLVQIYLQNRQSLALENRGGARANVDEVEILSINSVNRSKENGFVADTVWTVSGSVSHFGHTHYRRNKNHALVTFAADGGSWKIRKIELIDEKRLL